MQKAYIHELRAGDILAHDAKPRVTKGRTAGITLPAGTMFLALDEDLAFATGVTRYRQRWLTPDGQKVRTEWGPRLLWIEDR